MHERIWTRSSSSRSDTRKSKTCTEPRRSIQNRKWVGIVALVVTLAMCGARAEAQQQPKIPRIGFLTNNSSTGLAAADEAFRQGLRALGHVEGKSLVIEYRYGEGKLGRLAEMAAELVRLKVDVIVTGGPTSTRTAKQATSTIPIVMATDPDPVANGFVASLARPGGNITGLATLSPELSGKRLELMKEIVPRLSHVAVLGTSTNSGNAQNLREVELAAKAFGVKLQYLDVLSPKDIETAFRAASKARADAVLMLPGPVLVLERAQLTDLEIRAGSRRFIHKRNLRKPAALCTMALTLPTCSGAPPPTWTRSSKAPSPAIYPWSSRQSSSSSSI